MECFLGFAAMAVIVFIVTLIPNSQDPVLAGIAESLIIGPACILAIAVFTYSGMEWNLDMASTYAFLQSLILCGVCLKYLARPSRGNSK